MIPTHLYWVLWIFFPNMTNLRPPLSSKSTDCGFSRTWYEAFTLIITPFWDVIMYSLAHRCQCLGGNLCLLLFSPEDEDIRFLQNIAICQWHYMVSHNILVSFKILCSHSGADEDSTLVEITLCRMINSYWHLKECNAPIFRVKQSKKIYSLFHFSIIFVLYVFEIWGAWWHSG